MAWHDDKIVELVGKTIVDIHGAEEGNDEIVLTDDQGVKYKFYHGQDCCESVAIEDVIGDVSDLVGSPILQAEEVSSDDEPAPKDAESYTWTFYKFATIKGSVTVRWLGESNGYYSESVDFAIDREPAQ